MKTSTALCFKRLALLGLLAAMGLPGAASTTGESTQGAYTLEVQALQDVRQNTDVYVTVKPNSPDLSPVTSIKHLQLKSFDTEGKLRWTKNEQNVPTEVNAGDGSASAKLNYSDMARYQPVQAQVNVDTGKRNEVARTKSPVLFRPDLTVQGVNAPETVHINQVVNIVATLKEMQGDLGATATVTLSTRGHQLDKATGVKVSRHGASEVVFSTRFVEAGTYVLTVDIEDTEPGDYDTSNNSRDFVVRVVNDVRAVSYETEYSYSLYSLQMSWNSYYGSGEFKNHEENQGLTQNVFSSEHLSFPISKAVLMIDVDGQNMVSKEASNIPVSETRTNGCVVSRTGWKDLGDGITLSIQTYDECGAKRSHATFHQSATERVYYSKNHNIYWNSIPPQRSGNFLRAKDNVRTKFVVTGGNGVAIGGTAVTEVKVQESEASRVYPLPGGQLTWHQKISTGSGKGAGITKP